MTVLLGLLVAAVVAFGSFVTSEYSTTVEDLEQQQQDGEGFDMEELERQLQEQQEGAGLTGSVGQALQADPTAAAPAGA